MTIFKINKIIGLLIFVLLLQTLSGCTPNDGLTPGQRVRNNVDEWMRKQGETNKPLFLDGVYQQLRNGNPEQAITECEYLRSLRPDDNDVYMLEAYAYGEIKDYSSAVDRFSRVISSDPSRGDAYWFRADNFHYLKQYNDALRDIQNALNNSKTASQVIKFYTEMKGDDGSMSEKSINAYTYYKSASLHYHFGQMGIALEDINHAIQLKPGKPIFYGLRGKINFSNLQYERARADFKKVLGDEPNTAAAWNFLGFISLQTGDYDSAVMQFNKAIKNNCSSSGGCLTNLGVAYWLQGDKIRSLESLGRAFRTKPDFNTYYHAAYFQHLSGNQEKALEYYKKSYALDHDLLNKRETTLKHCPLSSPTRKFYQDEFNNAKRYLETGKTPAEVVYIKQKPSLDVTGLWIEPNPVRINEPFDIHVNFKLDIPSSQAKTIPTSLSFEISQSGKILLRSKSYSIAANNQEVTDWKLHMNPVSRGGTYTVKIVVQYEKLFTTKSIRMDIR